MKYIVRIETDNDYEYRDFTSFFEKFKEKELETHSEILEHIEELKNNVSHNKKKLKYYKDKLKKYENNNPR